MNDTAEAGVLTLICADLDARPLFWTASDRKRFGYEPEVAMAVANQMGLTLRWHFCRWSEFSSALHAGRADAIWCGCAITPERTKAFLFSYPYAVFHESVLVRDGDNISCSQDLAGRRVGAIANSTNMALAQTWPDCALFGFDGTSNDVFKEMIEALKSEKIDAVVDDEPAFGGFITSPEFKIAFTVKTSSHWGTARRRESVTLKKSFDSAIKQVIKSGELARIWKCHLGHIELPYQKVDE